MGGKPQKPKIQAYVEQRWFDEFEVYRTTHNLNQSKALEKILAEFFGGSSIPTLPPDGVTDVTTSVLVESLRAELTELRRELDQRLRLVENRLGLESAFPLKGLATDSVVVIAESATSQAESTTPLDRLATDLTTADSLNRLVNISARESSTIEATTAPVLVAESAANPATASVVDFNESASESARSDSTRTEVASVARWGEAVVGIPEPTAPSSESVEVLPSATSDSPISEASVETATTPSLEKEIDNDDVLPGSIEPPALLSPLTSLGLESRLGVDNSTISRHKIKGNEHFREWSALQDPDGIPWEFRKGKPRSPQFHPIV